MSYLLRATTLLTTLMCLCACHQHGRYSKIRTPEEALLFWNINDSMLLQSPKALELISQQMQEAEDSLTWYDYYLMYGRHFLLSETPDSSLPYADRTLRYVASLEGESPRTRGLQAMAISTKAAYHYLLHHPVDTTLQLYLRAYRLMMTSDITNKLPDLSANIADVYVSCNDLPNTSKWYRRALFLADSLELPRQQSLTIYMGLGRVYTLLRDFDMAATYYEMTDRRIDELKPNMKSYFLNNYGNYFYFRQDYRQALKVFRHMKAHLERHHQEQYFDMFLCKLNMADVFLNLNQTDSARRYVTEAEHYFRQQGVDIGVFYAQTIRLGIAIKEKKLDEARAIVQEAGNLKVDDIDMQAIRSNYMSHYYVALGDYRNAYAEQASNKQLNDSIRHTLLRLKSADIMTRLTEDTIRLHNQLRMNTERIKYEKGLSTMIFITALLIIIILLSALLISRQRKNYLQLRLNMLNARMQNARQRVSPHFVFNILNEHIAKFDKEDADQLRMLSRLIRTNLDLTHKTFVTIAEELDFIKDFITLLQETNQSHFDFHIEASSDELLQSTVIPSMLIQILTENAYLHGLKGQEGLQKIVIRVEETPMGTHITVSDNGPGFDLRQQNNERVRTGLNIIRTTVQAVNQENGKTVMRFDIHNDHGCHASLTIAKDTKYPTI